MTKKALAAVLLVLVLALSACSSGSTDTPPASTETTAADGGDTGATATAGEYVNTLCTSLDTWLTTVQTEAAAQTSGGTPKEAKAQIVSFLDSIADATDTLISDLEAVGPPDAENGAAAHAALLSAFEAVHEALHSALEQAEALSTKDATTFNAQVTAIQTQVQTASGQVTAALSGLSSGDLDQAAAETPACTTLMGSVGSVPTA